MAKHPLILWCKRAQMKQNSECPAHPSLTGFMTKAIENSDAVGLIHGPSGTSCMELYFVYTPSVFATRACK
jgi:hypothetical protein